MYTLKAIGLAVWTFLLALGAALLQLGWKLIKLLIVATLAAFICMVFIMLDKGTINVPSPSRPLPEQLAPVSISPNLNRRESTATTSPDLNVRTDAMRRATVLVQMPKSLGSGVIIDNKQCLVLTNHHVIDSPGDIRVSFVAGYRSDASPIIITVAAEMVAYPDPADDLALLRMESCPGARWAPLADSRSVNVLDTVFAVGAPRGLSWTFTQGVVSHTHRAVYNSARGTGQLVIQTDAAINPGNSGGPLFNTRGEVIGINSFILRESDNLGFAHPSNAARVYLAHVAKYGYLPRYPLGIEDAETMSYAQAVAERVPADYLREGSFGVMVKTVTANSLAEAAGIEAGDVILGFANSNIYSYESLRRALYAHGAGELAVVVLRNGELLNLTLNLPEPEVGRAPWAQPAAPAPQETPEA